MRLRSYCWVGLPGKLFEKETIADFSFSHFFSALSLRMDVTAGASPTDMVDHVAN